MRDCNFDRIFLLQCNVPSRIMLKIVVEKRQMSSFIRSFHLLGCNKRSVALEISMLRYLKMRCLSVSFIATFVFLDEEMEN